MDDFAYNKKLLINPQSYMMFLLQDPHKGESYIVDINYFMDVVLRLTEDGYILTVSYDKIDDVYMIYIKDKQ